MRYELRVVRNFQIGSRPCPADAVLGVFEAHEPIRLGSLVSALRMGHVQFVDVTPEEADEVDVAVGNQPAADQAGGEPTSGEGDLAWRDLPIDELDVAASVKLALTKHGLQTLGNLFDEGEQHSGLRHIKGIGEPTEELIIKAMQAFVS